MKKILVLGGMLLALTAGVAAAGPGLAIRWSDCFGDGGASNRNFACNTNVGSNVLVCSFVMYQDILQASGNEIVVDLASAGPVTPWWSFRNAGSCRQNSLGLNTTAPATAANCIDWANGQSVGGIGAYQNPSFFGPNSARIIAAIAVPATALADIFAGQEYFACNFTINNAKTVGTGSCAGCTTPMCIVFNSVRVTTQFAANDRTVVGPTNGTDSHYATWQGGAGTSTIRGTGCPRATPTRTATWGAVKSLYR